MSEDAAVLLFRVLLAPVVAEDQAQRAVSSTSRRSKGAKKRRRWRRVAEEAKRTLPPHEYHAVVEAARAAVPADLRGTGLPQESAAFLRARARLLHERLGGAA